MKLLSVNISLPKVVSIDDKLVATGIFKEPVAGRVRLHSLSLAGDGQADLENHGGIHKAVYAYPHEHYDYWSRELGRQDFTFGQFGENLTVTGLIEDQVHIGDMFRIGEALLEVTQPRVPCFKLASKMQMTSFPKLFAASGRTGFYLRVLAEGEIGAGDPIERVKTDARGLTVRALMDLMYFDRDNFALMETAVAIPALTPGWRDKLKQRLAAKHGDEKGGA
ncbi:MAG: molybdenum cofactor biosysynthesis protein [Pedosphaera sp.]|nr:molybdenum cofactor biosysynthesis protein [Pedosphaera sp.]